MITAQDIYNASHDGLDIILYYYPQASASVENPKKPFKRRPEEDDASAFLKKFKDCWKVTDFGDQGTAMSPIDICMLEENIKFAEAIVKLSSRYSVTDELKRSVNKPDIRKRPATADEQEGARFFELMEDFTDEQLKILGPRVKREHVNALHWHVAKSISYVKNREVMTKYTTPTYPIFMRECVISDSSDPDKMDRFYKVYEPLNVDKQWRFSYTPEGKKPRNYINGLYELKQAFAKYNTDKQKQFYDNPANEDKPYHEEKLKEVFICSGERDSLCVRALGYHPIWLNSETAKFSPEDMKEIHKYAEIIYNIPDIDATGVAKGRELALRYLDVHTVWLPSWLRDYKDHRGKPRKDLRDFVELRPSSEDFRNLMQLAEPAQFWVETYNERTKKRGYDIDSSCLHNLLNLCGFFTLHDDNSDSVRYIRVQGNIVKQLKTSDIYKFLNEFARERYLNRELRNLVLNSQRVSSSSLERLTEISMDFTNYTDHSQIIAFPDQLWEIDKDGIHSSKNTGQSGTYVWDTNVIPHKVSILPDMFDITVKECVDGTKDFDIKILDHDSNMLRYLINTSRIYWREELEYSFEDEGFALAEAYRKEHKFDISGPRLTDEQIKEQKLNLINKIFAIGYNLHRYKCPSRAWALYAMDNKIGDDDECNGRSGKSFLFNTFSQFMRSVKLSGRNPKLMDNPHVFDQVNQFTDFILVDDCSKYLNVSLFYDLVSGGMTVNPKNNRSFYIDFKDSPKFGFTTNYVPSEFDPSTNARLLFMVFSDYYHEKTMLNDYLESRSIRDDFNKNLMTDYNETEWNNDINFFAQCLVFYLKMIDKGIKIQPPLDNILKRKYKSDMGANFEDWAYQYFSEESEHLDCCIVREEALEDFKRFANMPRCTMQRFTKALNGFANLCPYVSSINPPDLLNSSGRLMKKVEGKTKEMIYVRTVRMAQKIAAGEAMVTASEDGSTGLPFVPVESNPDEPF